MIRKLVSWHTVDELVWLLRYKTTVLSAREKVSIRLCAQKRTWHVFIGCYSHIDIGT